MTSETDKPSNPAQQWTARRKFLELSLESTRKSYYPQLKKQLENAKDNQRRLQLLIDNLPAQISYVNSSQQYVFINREFEKTFGLARDQIIGRKMEDILGKRIYSDVKSHVERVLSGKAGHFELSIAGKAGSLKWFEVNYVPETDRDGNTSGFYILTIDLTDMKKEEKERMELKDRLRRTQKMEAIGTLSGGIAHDFNNILSGIFGYSQLIQSQIHNPESVLEYNQKIFDGAQRAASLIQQILSFSRQAQYIKKEVRLLDVTTEALDLIRSTIPSNIEIRTQLNCQAMMLADPTQIHQVIMNLCTNAYHAMGDENGVLTVTLDETESLPARPDKTIRKSPGRHFKISISDTGPGIPDHIREKIFDPYFTTKKIDRGTGLGLAVVDGIVKKHGGFIDFETKLGVGTTFFVYLPLIDEDAIHLGGKEENVQKSSEGVEKIMLVDDEEAILHTLKIILSHKGYQVSTFSNGVSALRAFLADPDQFDLVVTDMTMPKMTGDKLSREILKIRPNLPIAICTGYHANFTEEQAKKTGIRKYIHKPVSGSELAEIIRELMD